MRVRLRPGAVIDCDSEYNTFVDLMKYVDTVAVGVQPMYLRPRAVLGPALEIPRKRWGAYEWVGFWNYAALGTATILSFLLLRLGGLR